MVVRNAGSNFWKLTKETLRNTVFYGVPAACFLHTVFDYVGEIAPSRGPSMLPTINIVGDFLLVERLPGWRKRIKIGEIVTFVSPLNPQKRASKRVLGMPGDVVCVDPTMDKLAFVVVPRGHVWLQGDNYSNSTDSRTYGPVPMGLLRGRVLGCFLPSMRLLPSVAEIIPGHFEDPPSTNNISK